MEGDNNEVCTDLTCIDLAPLGAQVGAEGAGEGAGEGAITCLEAALQRGVDLAEVVAEPVSRFSIARWTITLCAKLARWVRDG